MSVIIHPCIAFMVLPLYRIQARTLLYLKLLNSYTCRLHPAVDGSHMHALPCRLLDTLVPHLEGNNLEVSPELEELPDDIILAQTVAAWKYIVHFQAKQRQD